MLQEFASDWVAWVEAGAPEHTAFGRDLALCSSVRLWATNCKGMSMSDSYALQDELRACFERSVPEGTNYNIPFNTSQTFWEETVQSTKHLNVQRFAFAKKLAKGLV